MDPTTFLILLLLGLLAGILAGLFGLGGGILFTPVLFLYFTSAGITNPVVLSIGTSLLCIFMASLASSIRQYRQKNFYWKSGLKVGLLGVIGVTIGKWVITSPFYSRQIFVVFFSLLLLFVAYMFFRRGSDKRSADDNQSIKPIQLSQAGVTGGLGGFAAALAGIGGGGVMVPLMNLYYKKPFHQAASISSSAIVILSLAGWLQLGFAANHAATLTYYAWGYVDFGVALPLSIGALAGGTVGAYLNFKLNRRYLQYAFALLAVGMAVKLLVEVF